MEARVASIHLYPVKGAGGIALDRARIEVAGLASGGIGDREWMALDRQGRFVTQREQPRLALVGTAIRAARLELSVPGLAPLSLPSTLDGPVRDVAVWNSSMRALDAGDEAADWLSAALGIDARLVRFDPSDRRHCNRDYVGDSGAHTRFADAFPLLVIGSGSLAELNRRLGERGHPPLPMDRFRPNLVLDGLEPHDEDLLEAIDIEGIVLKPVKPCTRCQVTTTDQATGHVGVEPLRTLGGYRMDERLGGVTFGMNTIVIEGAGRDLRAGAVATCTYAF
jgi:uncharacterized protein YcbX